MKYFDSYEAERRPIAERNTAFARSMAESVGRMPVPEVVEDKSSFGDFDAYIKRVDVFVNGSPSLGTAKAPQREGPTPGLIPTGNWRPMTKTTLATEALCLSSCCIMFAH